MKRKKSGSYSFRLLIITVLSIIALSLLSDGRSTGRGFFGVAYAEQEGGTPPSESNADPRDAIQIIEGTINRIGRLGGVVAEIKLTSFIDGEKFSGDGKYEELNDRASDGDRRFDSRPGIGSTQFRLHLKIYPPSPKAREQGGEENILEVVRDRNSLWTFTSVEGEKHLTEINLDELSGYLSQLTKEELKTLGENGIELPCSLGSLPGLGGIAGTLRALLNWYDFNPVPEHVFFNEGKYPAWKLTGTMKQDRFETLKRRLGGEESGFWPEISANLPVRVEVFIGKESPFPNRIRYSSRPTGSEEFPVPVLVLEFDRVYEGRGDLDPTNFIYAPKINSERITGDYLKKLIPGIEL